MLVFSICLLMLTINIAPIQPTQSPTEPHTARIRKRSFSPWSANSNFISLYQAGNTFKPATYALPRPYYIPVYGAPGNFIFYPPQPLYENPGSPLDNPAKPSQPIGPYQGSAYLPPKEPTNQTLISDRIRGDDYEEEERFVFSNTVQMPLSGGRDQSKEGTVIPTRPPVPSTSNRPTLVHDQAQNQRKQAPQTSKNNQRPQSTTSTTTGPSNCVWAIISCCSAADPKQFSHNCFEQRGCPGPFWGDSPCNGDFARAAIAAAVKYYSTHAGAAPPVLGK